MIVINLQDGGRARTFGILGVLLVLAGVIVGAVSRSVGNVYGTDTITFDVGTIVVGGCAAAGLVLLALAVVGPRRPRAARGGR